MLNHRLQVLIPTEQHRRLAAAARRRGSSIGVLVREAIAEKVGERSGEQRIAAVEEMARTASGPAPTLAEIERLLDAERLAGAGEEPGAGS